MNAIQIGAINFTFHHHVLYQMRTMYVSIYVKVRSPLPLCCVYIALLLLNYIRVFQDTRCYVLQDAVKCKMLLM